MPSQEPPWPPLRRRAIQAGSTLFLAAATINITFTRSSISITDSETYYEAHVDPWYVIGCWCNFIVSFLYHGLQEPTLPPNDKRHLVVMRRTQCRIKDLAHRKRHEYEYLYWPCSKSNESLTTHWALKRLDQAFVCFICLYTGFAATTNKTDDVFLALVLSISFLAGSAGMPINGLVVGWALYLTMSPESNFWSHTLVSWHRGVFVSASVIASICFVCVSYIHAWCAPVRYVWHFCCACLISVGGLMNLQV